MAQLMINRVVTNYFVVFRDAEIMREKQLKKAADAAAAVKK